MRLNDDVLWNKIIVIWFVTWIKPEYLWFFYCRLGHEWHWVSHPHCIGSWHVVFKRTRTKMGQKLYLGERDLGRGTDTVRGMNIKMESISRENSLTWNSFLCAATLYGKPPYQFIKVNNIYYIQPPHWLMLVISLS